MSLYGYPVLYALFVWWFSTGIIIFLDNLPVRTFRWSMAAGTMIFALSLHRLAASADDTSLAGAYAAFTYGVLAWGWQEMGFFMGYVTGPRKTACDAGCGGWRHFWHGVEACLYHELAIIATALAIVALTWGGANQVGAWTYGVLWVMRQSAKLNVFLGVRNLSEEFVPAHMAYLKSYLTRKPMNLLFPVSVTLGTVALVVLARRAAAADGFHAARLTFVCVMLGLAVVEHWFLVLPLPFAELWTWLLRRRDAVRAKPRSPAIRDEVRPPAGEPGRTAYQTRAATAPG